MRGLHFFNKQRRFPNIENTIFFTYDEQIQKLINEKQLIISDLETTKSILQKLSYFSLVDNYKDIFTHKPSGKYLHGVTFEEITALVKTISLPSHYRYIIHYAKTYDNVPLWITVNALTFGQISKMYQYTTSDIRSKISLNFSNISESQLHQLIRILANCRNICAHNECLYSFQINEAISDMPLHKELKLPQKNGQYSIGKKDLFAVVIALRYLIDTKDFKQFKKELNQLILSAFKNCPHLTPQVLFSKMGFPANWKNL